ncbi:unnamed protein product [Absidia cylindrospora]
MERTTKSFDLNAYVKDDINDDAARIQLLQLCADLKDEERHVIQAIVELIPTLYNCNLKPLSENHLSSSCVHPFLHGLFSSKAPPKVAHCSNLIVDEDNTNNNRRPDYRIDVYESYEYAYTTAYGEIKASMDASPPGFPPGRNIL